MKKTLIAISFLFLAMNCFAEETPKTVKPEVKQSTTEATTLAPIEDGKQYVVLTTPPSPEKEVIEFFSFNCPSCDKFENEFHGSQIIGETLPAGVKFKRYHLENFGPLSMDLAKAWAIANVLGIQSKVSDALYTAIQTNHSIKTADDIKAVFANLGVDSETYDKTKDSFLVKAFMVQQSEAINEMLPDSIPSVFVNRKFYINSNQLDKKNGEAFVNDYTRVIAFLLNLNPNINPENKFKK